jgi:exodeoxyribonuclease V alpha subunit
MSSVTNHAAFTVHKAFEASGDSLEEEGDNQSYIGVVDNIKVSNSEWIWGFSVSNPHPCEYIIIDESSMIDLNLLHCILSCTSENCKILFVGDYAQLPSVGPGNVLKDLIHSNLFPVTKLTEIFRQKDTSGIVYASHSIHRGEMPLETEDFNFIETTEEEASDIITSLASDLFSRRENFQVVSPRHLGKNGVTKLNDLLRSCLNPVTPGLVEIKLGQDIIREGDRIMIIRNNYQKGVFNGESGKVSILDNKSKMCTIKIHGSPDRLVPLSFKELPKYIRLAYACTVHKVQGLEFDTVIVPIFNSFGPQLQRNLYYTAVTRAKKQVHIVGSKSALAKAISNDSEESRNSLLKFRLLRYKGSV